MWFDDTTLSQLARRPDRAEAVLPAPGPGFCPQRTACGSQPEETGFSHRRQVHDRWRGKGEAQERSEWHRAVIVNEPSAAFGR
jgi:hypothetical protein